MNNIASLYIAKDKYEDALPYYMKALKILEAEKGLDHPDVATNLNNLGELFRVQKKYDLALPYYERALEIRKNKLGT